MTNSLVWVNGETVAADLPTYYATDRGATLGDAIFDTCLCLNGRTVWKDAHFERTLSCAKTFEHVIDKALLSEAYELANQTRVPSVLRIAISRGPGTRGFDLRQSGASQITATISPLPSGIMFSAQTLTPTNIRRNETSWQSQHKTAAYVDAILAQKQAKADGFHDAIFLNTKGNLACTTLANLFIVKGSTLMTPPLSSGTISGITRGKVLGFAKALGLEPFEAVLSEADLLSADEVFATNSLRLVMPAPNLCRNGTPICKEIAQQLIDGIRIETATGFDPKLWI